MWTKRGAGHGLRHGLGHGLGYGLPCGLGYGLPCGLLYGLPVVRFSKPEHNVSKTGTDRLA